MLSVLTGITFVAPVVSSLVGESGLGVSASFDLSESSSSKFD